MKKYKKYIVLKLIFKNISIDKKTFCGLVFIKPIFQNFVTSRTDITRQSAKSETHIFNHNINTKRFLTVKVCCMTHILHIYTYIYINIPISITLVVYKPYMDHGNFGESSVLSRKGAVVKGIRLMCANMVET